MVLFLLRWMMLLREEWVRQLHRVLFTWEWLRCNDSSRCAFQNKTSSRHCWEGKMCSRHLAQALGLGHHPWKPSSTLVKNCTSSNWTDTLRSVFFVIESWPCESPMRTLCVQPNCKRIDWGVATASSGLLAVAGLCWQQPAQMDLCRSCFSLLLWQLEAHRQPCWRS